ncbi:MAG: hypothetical protein AAFQ67_06825 [Pseudomonadota bacterium]
MMKGIMISGSVAAALAASAILAPEAAAQRGDRDQRRAERAAQAQIDDFFGRDRELRGGPRGEVIVDVDRAKRGRHDPYGKPYRHGYRPDAVYYGASLKELRRNAARQCRRAIRREARYIGFRDVDFDGRRIKQIGPRGFAVTFDTEFEGRRREFDRYVTCVVRRGEVRRIEGVPRPGRRHGKHYGYSAYSKDYKPYVSNGITVTFGKHF